MINICGDDRDRGGKREPDVHAARISFQWLINEVADLSKARDLRKQAFRLRFRKTHQRRVHENVFDAGELRVEACAELEQCGHASFEPDVSVRAVRVFR